MKRGALSFLAAGALAAASSALACGICIEDQVAVVYDHAVVTRAMDRGRIVVFAEAEGAHEAKAVGRMARAAAKGVSGIEPATVRAAGAAPVSISFALDPAVRTPADALAALERAAGRGLRLRLLKVLP